MKEHPVLLFDGVCNFCNAGVNYIIRQDKKKIFRFATLQSPAGQELLQRHQLPTGQLDSFVLIKDGKAFTKSTAGLKVYSMLPWYWQWTQVFWIVPRFIRDAVYDLIAKKRYKWFGRKEECMVPTADVRNRFLG